MEWSNFNDPDSWDLPPKVGDLIYVTIYGHFLGTHSLHGEHELDPLILAMEQFRSEGNLPGVDPRIDQATELVLYFLLDNHQLTVLYPEDNKRDH